MPIFSASERDYQQAYNILCQHIPLRSQSHPYPFNLVSCKIEAGGKTERHAHSEPEVFIIQSGSGSVTLETQNHDPKNSAKKDKTRFLVGPGDVVKIDSMTEHQIENNSPEPLMFFSVYFSTAAKKEKIFAVSAPPTPNGPMHLGHLSGPYLAADLLKRAGSQVQLVSGLDDHQSYIRGLIRKPNGQKKFLKNRESIQSSFAKASIAPDYWILPHQNQPYEAGVRKLWSELTQSRFVQFREKPVSVCREHGVLYGGYLQGQCPHCGSDSTGGGCETCFLPNDHQDLKKSTCTECGKATHLEVQKVWVLDLEALRPQILQALAGISMQTSLREKLIEAAFKYNEFILAFPGNFGIRTTDGKNLIINEWIEMALAYIFGFAPEKTAEDAIIQFFGVDNSYYYGFIHLAIYLAMGQSQCIPIKFVCNQFLHLDSEKFSTSRSHAIWVDVFAQKTSLDGLRLYLARLHSGQDANNFTQQAIKNLLTLRKG